MYLELDGIRLRLESKDSFKKKGAWWLWKQVSQMQNLVLEANEEYVTLSDDWRWTDTGVVRALDQTDNQS